MDETSKNPEGESKPQGFRIRVENPDLILQAAQKGVSGELGKQFMESPMEHIEVELDGQGKVFNLSSTIDLTFEANHDTRGFRVEQIYRNIAQKFPDSKERGQRYIVTAKRGTQFIVGEGSMAMNNISVSTGTINDLMEKRQMIPAQETSKENFDRVMADFVDVLTIATQETYKRFNKAPPQEELVIHPPSQSVVGENIARGLFGEKFRTPKELLGKLAVEKPNIHFEDIGGQPKAKKEIEGLAFAVKNPELYKKWGTRPPKGIILYGPPGTGKTLMAKALATQAEAQFLHIQASDVASKWYGESEQIVQAIFQFAGQMTGKTIIFVDEIDAIAPHREGSHEVTQRVLGTLLENMDGLASKDNVVVVASTNRLDAVEPALLRSGRFDRWVEVGLPDEEGRRQIFQIHMDKAEQTAGRKLFGEINLGELIAKTEKTNGADIAEIIRRTLEEKVRQEGTTSKEATEVKTEDVLRELENYEKTKSIRKQLGFSAPNGK